MQAKATGAIIIMIILFAILILVSWLSGVSKEVIIALFAAAVSVIGWIYSSSKNSTNEAVARLFSEKAAVYKKIFMLLPEQIKKNKGFTPSSDPDIEEQELAIKMFDIKSELLIWGSDETIKAWIDVEQVGIDDPEYATKVIVRWTNLFECMRSDLGHNDLELSTNDFAGFFLDAEGKAALSGSVNETKI